MRGWCDAHNQPNSAPQGALPRCLPMHATLKEGVMGTRWAERTMELQYGINAHAIANQARERCDRGVSVRPNPGLEMACKMENGERMTFANCKKCL
jgi:hypothetical protein